MLVLPIDVYENISKCYSIYSSIQVSNTAYAFSIIFYKKKDTTKDYLENIFKNVNT